MCFKWGMRGCFENDQKYKLIIILIPHLLLINFIRAGTSNSVKLYNFTNYKWL